MRLAPSRVPSLTAWIIYQNTGPTSDASHRHLSKRFLLSRFGYGLWEINDSVIRQEVCIAAVWEWYKSCRSVCRNWISAVSSVLTNVPWKESRLQSYPLEAKHQVRVFFVFGNQKIILYCFNMVSHHFQMISAACWYRSTARTHCVYALRRSY